MDSTAKHLTELIRYEICGDVPEIGNFSDEELKNIFLLSKKHDLAHMAGDALLKLNCCNSETKKKFQKEIITAVYRFEKLEITLADIRNGLDVPFIPLKGAVLRQLYPEKWLRTSCDVDILVKKQDHEKAVEFLREKLNCEQTYRTSHDVSLSTPNGTHIEIHHTLIEPDIVSDSVLENVWEYAKQKNGFEYELDDAMFYCYHIAHMAKHFRNAGCGIRPFIDLFILRHRTEYDAEKRRELIRLAGLEKFAFTAEKLSDIWFSGDEYDELTLCAEKYLLAGGVYGNTKNSIASKQAQMGKGKYIMSRIWLPYDKLKGYYENLDGRRYLLLFYEICRWFRIVIKERGKNSVFDLAVGSGISKSELSEVENMLKEFRIK